MLYFSWCHMEQNIWVFQSLVIQFGVALSSTWKNVRNFRCARINRTDQGGPGGTSEDYLIPLRALDKAALWRRLLTSAWSVQVADNGPVWSAGSGPRRWLAVNFPTCVKFTDISHRSKWTGAQRTTCVAATFSDLRAEAAAWPQNLVCCLASYLHYF